MIQWPAHEGGVLPGAGSQSACVSTDIVPLMSHPQVSKELTFSVLGSNPLVFPLPDVAVPAKSFKAAVEIPVWSPAWSKPRAPYAAPARAALPTRMLM